MSRLLPCGALLHGPVAHVAYYLLGVLAVEGPDLGRRQVFTEWMVCRHRSPRFRGGIGCVHMWQPRFKALAVRGNSATDGC